MRILFLEVRSKTYTYQQIAKELEKAGHEISWLVYNHAIKLSCGSINIIPYPKKSELVYDESKLSTSYFEEVATSDRGVLYCGGNIKHYPYYWGKIEEILDKEKPDVVLGEPSAFYAVMCRILCEQKNIPMHSESVARYPRNRFTFNFSDRYRQVSSSGDKVSFSDAKRAWTEIIQRNTRPEYMDRFSKDLLSSLKIHLNYSLHRLQYYFQYLKGDKYLTRSLRHTFKEKRTIKNNNHLWNTMAVSKITQGDGFGILFPLQYQPEFNVDVWGGSYRNQSRTARQILNRMPKGCKLYIKPNPASGLEINEDLLSLVSHSDKVSALGTGVDMANVIDDIGMVVTITGTIAIECVMSSKPVVSLAETEASRFTGCVHPKSIDKLSGLIDMAMLDTFPTADDNEKYRFYSHLLDSSHDGTMQDFIMVYGALMDSENLKKLVIGYSKFLEQLESGTLDFNGKENLTNSQS